MVEKFRWRFSTEARNRIRLITRERSRSGKTRNFRILKYIYIPGHRLSGNNLEPVSLATVRTNVKCEESVLCIENEESWFETMKFTNGEKLKLCLFRLFIQATQSVPYDSHETHENRRGLFSWSPDIEHVSGIQSIGIQIEGKNDWNNIYGWWRDSERNGRGCFIRVMLIEHAEGPGVLWFARKNNRPSRSLWRHYPVRLESIFSTCCGNDCTPLLTGAAQASSLQAARTTSNTDTRPRLPLRHLSLIRLTTDSAQVLYTHARVCK